MGKSPFRVKCLRCGEYFYPTEQHEVFRVSYETVGYFDKITNKDEGEKRWCTLDLCGDCQCDLRLEFYQRGMMRHDW